MSFVRFVIFLSFFVRGDQPFSHNECYTYRTVVKLNQFGGETFLSI